MINKLIYKGLRKHLYICCLFKINMVDLKSTKYQYVGILLGENKKITKKSLQKKLDELTNLLKRVQADFENYKKRVEKEKIEFVKYASADVIRKMLPIIDSFEQAVKNGADEGTKSLYSQFLDVLFKEGLKKIECAGKLFDPFLHEAMMQAVSDKEEGTILEELQTGFMFNDAVLRHAKVKVAKNGDNKKNTA